jgi:hypothetical protein
MPNGMPDVSLQLLFLIRETPPHRAMGGGAGEALVGEKSYDPEVAGTGGVIALRLASSSQRMSRPATGACTNKHQKPEASLFRS